MNRQFFPFACLLFMMASGIIASAQEISAVNDTALNGTALSNNTTSNATLNDTAIASGLAEVPAANETMQTAANETEQMANDAASMQNESLQAENETMPAENLTSQEMAAPAATLEVSEGPASVETLGSANMIASAKKPAFAIGGGASIPNLFSVTGKYLPEEAYDVGLPAETIMDLSSMPFYVNKI